MPTVHILHYGVTLCGITSLPKDWADGDRWIGKLEHQIGRWHADCPECLRKLSLEEQELKRKMVNRQGGNR